MEMLERVTRAIRTHFGTDMAAEIVARAAITAMPSQWQPIDTAPKDGRWIWLGNEYMMRVGRWASGTEYEHSGSVGGGWRDFALTEGGGVRGDLPMTPTHWMSLPDAPRS